MNIQTRGIMRQLSYALRMAEKLSEMLLECDDEVFDPVASEIASGLEIMAIEILRQKRAELREKAKFYNRRHKDGTVGVRTHNLLLQCAQLTCAIIVLSRV